jgi:hypothetical protein
MIYYIIRLKVSICTLESCINLTCSSRWLHTARYYLPQAIKNLVHAAFTDCTTEPSRPEKRNRALDYLTYQKAWDEHSRSPPLPPETLRPRKWLRSCFEGRRTREGRLENSSREARGRDGSAETIVASTWVTTGYYNGISQVTVSDIPSYMMRAQWWRVFRRCRLWMIIFLPYLWQQFHIGKISSFISRSCHRGLFFGPTYQLLATFFLQFVQLFLLYISLYSLTMSLIIYYYYITIRISL